MNGASARPPNVVLVLVDDMGYGDLGCFGNEAVETPCLDALAGEGVSLLQHYAGSPVCAPSRAALMTGRYPHRTGAIDTLEGRGLDRLALREVTLADAFKAAGYATGLFGKWHLGALDPRYHPNGRGFDEFAGFRGGWSDYYQWRLDYNGSFCRADGRYLTDVFTDEAVGFIERHAGEPFLLHVTYNAPHTPLQVPEEDVAPFRETDRFPEGVARIYGMNRRLDRGVGRILEALGRHGLARNTFVLFTSDNGPQFGVDRHSLLRGQSGADGPDMTTTRFNAHFNGCKGNVYEGGIRVPAILRWPAGLEGGRRLGAFVHFTDWFPTLLEAAGVEEPDHLPLDGGSVLAALRGEPCEASERRFWQWNRYTPVGTCNAAMRDGPWKLLRPVIREAMGVTPEDLAMDRRLKYEPEAISDIRRDPEPERAIPRPPPPMLFNIEDDPYEEHDLAADQPGRVRRMEAALGRWFEEVEAERRSIAD
jgi:arylsulfatase A